MSTSHTLAARSRTSWSRGEHGKFFWLQQELKELQCVSVHPAYGTQSSTSCYKILKLTSSRLQVDLELTNFKLFERTLQMHFESIWVIQLELKYIVLFKHHPTKDDLSWLSSNIALLSVILAECVLKVLLYTLCILFRRCWINFFGKPLHLDIQVLPAVSEFIPGTDDVLWRPDPEPTSGKNNINNS